ncbi:MAG: CPBP family intramembrane metalloprotease [Puniceicoccales bacterium]|jgi:membrane protease YdiL (CAAX protease family)|nr:CPBP family intramembrane metalloprotease [Puniceicoccales bacterium]
MMNQNISWTVYFNGAQLLGGFCCLLQQWLQHDNLRRPKISPWHTSWSNFLLFCWIFWMVTFLPSFTQSFCDTTHGIDTTLFLGNFLAQCLLLAIIYGFCKKNTFHYASTLSLHTSSLGTCMGRAIFSYLCLNAILFTISSLWLFLCLSLSHFFTFNSLKQQELLQFLSLHPPFPFPLVAVFSAVILAPIVEEIFFRGGIYRFLCGKIHRRWAALITAALFSLLHGNILASVPLFFLSLLLTHFYEKEQSLLVAILIHGMFNGNGILLTLLHCR